MSLSADRLDMVQYRYNMQYAATRFVTADIYCMVNYFKPRQEYYMNCRPNYLYVKRHDAWLHASFTIWAYAYKSDGINRLV